LGCQLRYALAPTDRGYTAVKLISYNFSLIPTPIARVLYKLLFRKDRDFSRKLYKHLDSAIYIHIPKTGGNSIEKSLGLLKTGHKPLKSFELSLTKEEFSDAYVFTVVRNPFTRLASAYYYLKSDNISEEDKEFRNNVLSKYPNFEVFVKDYIKNEGVYGYIHFIPQFEFITKWNGTIRCDEIIKLDNIDAGFEKLRVKLGRENSTLTHKNKTVRKTDYLSQYDDEMKEIVRKVYSDDFALLGS
jgi:hypothetical protein